MTEWLLNGRAFLLSLLVIFILGYAAQNTLSLRYIDAVRTEERALVTERLGNVRYQLESLITNNLSLINGVAAFVSSYPDFTPAQFQTYAQTVLSREPSLVNLALAPNLVVSQIYPLAGNEAALGLNYLQNADQRDAVLRVVESGEMVIAGPLQLVQGGFAFVGRAPIYVTAANGEKQLWGIVSAPILAENIYRDAGLLDDDQEIRIAIRGRNGLGNQGDFFFGDQEIVNNPRLVSMPVNIGGGSWEIVAIPTQDMLAGNPLVTVVRVFTTIAVLAILIMLGLARRQVDRDKAFKQIIFRNEKFLRAVETVSHVGGWRMNSKLMFTELSDQARSILDLPAGDEMVSLQAFCSAFDESSAEVMRNQFVNAIKFGERFDTEMCMHLLDGSTQWLHLKAEVLDTASKDRELMGAIQDVSLAKKAESLIEYQANYDALTGLPNRALFRDRLDTALLAAQRHSTKLAVMFIDVDNFKSVNDNLGHDAGDALLIEVSQRIQDCIRETDTVARYSGDEFVVIIGDINSTSVVGRIANDMSEMMNEPFHPTERQVYCTVSIGISLFPDDADDVETLIIKADQAMYEVKKDGRNGWQFYTAQMKIESEYRHHLYNELLNALNENQLQVYFQPIIDVSTGSISECEALVRWQKQDGQWVSPEEFISVAEERGIINRIDFLVLQSACESIQKLNKTLITDLRLSVNVSSRLLHLRDLVAQDWLAHIRTLQGLKLTVEITERILVEDAQSARRILDELHQLGVNISIDDFGTGYSGLSYFSQFPVSSMKIDRSFINKIGVSATEEALIESMVLMAGKLNLRVVAEGVETAEQLAFLSKLGCSFVQGYYLAKPMPYEELVEFAKVNIINGKSLAEDLSSAS